MRRSDTVVTRVRETPLRSPFNADWAAPSADELIDVVGTEAVLGIVGAAFVDPGEHVVIPGGPAVWVNIDHRAVHLKQRDHLLHVRVDHKRVGFSGRLVGIGALRRDSIVLQVTPFTLQHEGMHRLRVAMAREHASLANPQKVHPVAP